jgi:alpha-tubulin suppressor-like RCC1 family protein
MPYEPTTNFRDSNNVDLGKKLVTKDYLLDVYGSILESIGNSGLTVSPALWTWGQNSFGQLGIGGDVLNRTTPVTTILGGTNWKSVAGGSFHTAAIKTDGTLWTWGRGDNGQLGINATTNRTTPVTTILGGTNWKSVAAGQFDIAAIKTDGTLWTWGSNAQGQLGIGGDVLNRTTPVTTILGGTNWKSVSCGYRHIAAIKTDGTLWTWGSNINAQLGINGSGNRTTPVTTFLGGTDWKSVACGGYCTVAIKTDGTLWTWGRNSYGELGINNTTQKSTPVTTILGGTNWKSVAGGFGHTAATKTDGTLWVWGLNDFVQLGINNAGNRSIPVTTFAGGTNWSKVFESSSASSHTAAIKTDGTLWTWGNNGQGALGINATTNRSTPVTTILGGTDWKSVSCGAVHTATIESVDYI